MKKIQLHDRIQRTFSDAFQAIKEKERKRTEQNKIQLHTF